MPTKPDRPPTLAALRREARRIWGPRANAYKSLSLPRTSVLVTGPQRRIGENPPQIRVTATTSALARRALMAALRALPDYREEGKR